MAPRVDMLRMLTGRLPPDASSVAASMTLLRGSRGIWFTVPLRFAQLGSPRSRADGNREGLTRGLHCGALA